MSSTLRSKIFCAIFLSTISLTQSYAQGVMTTIIGDSTAGYSGDNGPSNMAQVNLPHDVCMDDAGNMYIADMGNFVVRKITKSTGVITTIAGTHTGGSSADGIPATSAQLLGPAYICLDHSGNLYISDGGDPAMSITGGYKVRKVNLSTGIITTAAGNGVMGSTGDGGAATAANLYLPQGICTDADDNLYIVDWNASCVRKVAKATGIISTIAGSTTTASGNSGDGGLAVSALLAQPQAICMTPNGDIYISDQRGAYIRKIVAGTGMMMHVAGNGGLFSGDGGPATAAGLGNVDGLCCDGHGDVYCNEWSCSCRKITTATGIINILAGDPAIDGYNGDGGTATSIYMDWPAGLCVDPSNGNIIIADAMNERIRNTTQPGFIPTTGTTKVTIPDAGVYPNPSATGRFLVTVAEDQELSNVEVVNAAGDVVYSSVLQQTQNNIDLSKEPAGMYFMIIKSAAGTTTQKLLIAK